MSIAKQAKDSYRRNLPHFQKRGATLFITFNAMNRQLFLPPAARDIALEHCLKEHDVKHHIHTVVIMPEHVHILTTPLDDSSGSPFGIEEIMKPIKGVSARRINQLLGRRGTLWQDESFDHSLRSHESTRQKAEYIANNPVRRGLVETPDEYPWLWRDWVEGVKHS
ncbi:MAG TPA: transposase [Thermoanaerobaculia bacterium]|nr:transposase [Thermoanaerobaculia bacterium]